MPRILHRLLARPGRRPRTTSSPLLWRRRPRVEALEDRMNPVGLTFVPFSVVAANATSASTTQLPPSALIQFNPLPDVNNLPAVQTSFQSPIAIVGSFQQAIAPSPSSTVTGRLTVNYSLKGSVSGTVTPPTGLVPGSFSATFKFTGTATETLTLPGATLLSQFPWVINTTITESGSVSGPLNTIQVGAAVTDPMSFSENVGLTQIEYQVTPLGIPTVPWYIQANLTVKPGDGLFQVVVPPPGTTVAPDSVAATFTLKDGLDESLSTPAANPLPPYKISGTDSASGGVTEAVYFVSPTAIMRIPTIMPSYVTGKTQYHEDLNETITSPTGGMQTLTEAFDTSGLFEYGQLLFPTAPEPTTTADAAT